MALVFHLREGSRFFVDHVPVTVSQILPEGDYRLKVEGGDEFHIVEDQSTEILPDVFISAGFEAMEGFASLAIQAPKRIEIWRAKNYYKKFGKPNDGDSHSASTG